MSEQARVDLPDDALAAAMQAIAGGDGSALSVLYAATRRRVFGLVRHVVADPRLAEEVTLDVYTQVWTRAARYDVSRGGVVGWLLVLARSRAIDALREQRRRSAPWEPLEGALHLPDAQPGPDAALGAGERARSLRQALLRLTEEQRQAIEAAYFAGLSHREVARCLGEPLGTIKTRIRAGLAVLRRELSAGEGLA